MRCLFALAITLIFSINALANYDVCAGLVRAEGMATFGSGSIDFAMLLRARRGNLPSDAQTRNWGTNLHTRRPRHLVAKLPSSQLLPSQSLTPISDLTRIEGQKAWTTIVEIGEGRNALAAALLLPELVGKPLPIPERDGLLSRLLEPEIESMRIRAIADYASRAGVRSLQPSGMGSGWYGSIGSARYPSNVAELLNVLEVERVSHLRSLGSNQATNDITRIIGDAYDQGFQYREGTLYNHAINIRFDTADQVRVSLEAPVNFEYKIGIDGKVAITVRNDPSSLAVTVWGLKAMSPEESLPKATVLINNLLQALAEPVPST